MVNRIIIIKLTCSSNYFIASGTQNRCSIMYDYNLLISLPIYIPYVIILLYNYNYCNHWLAGHEFPIKNGVIKNNQSCCQIIGATIYRLIEIIVHNYIHPKALDHFCCNISFTMMQLCTVRSIVV